MSILSITLLISYYRYFSQEPHFAGSKRNNFLALHIAAKWKEYDFDHIEIAKYDVLINTPWKELKNTVKTQRNGDVVLKSQPHKIIGYMTISQLTVYPCGLVAQWIEHCAGKARSWVRIPFKPEFFFQVAARIKFH